MGVEVEGYRWMIPFLEGEIPCSEEFLGSL
jgi:hypothetical protein